MGQFRDKVLVKLLLLKGEKVISSVFIYVFITFIVTFIGIKLFIYVAPKLSLVDIPNERSSHKEIVPRGAGIIFGFIFICTILKLNIDSIGSLKYTILSIVVVYIAGITDDLIDISSKKKFIFLIVASVIAFYSGYEISYLGAFGGYELHLGFLAFPFTVFSIVGFTNSINLSDGLDGLAGSISVVILSALLIIGLIHHDEMLISWSAILISVLVAFLFFNWSPAKVFMGDSGSLTIGFIIALLSIKALAYINPVVVLFLVAVPILDTLVVFRRRMQRGLSPFKADKNHLHHILFDMKQDKSFTVKMLITMQLSFSCLFLQLYKQNDLINLAIFILLFTIFFNLFDPRTVRRGKNARVKRQHKNKNKREIIL